MLDKDTQTRWLVQVQVILERVLKGADKIHFNLEHY